MNQTEHEQKRLELETLAYKRFMKVAKKITYLQYGKWQIVPSPTDPLRKFTLEKDIGWATIKLQLRMEEFYHRAVYDDTRRDYRALVIFGGLYAHSTTDLNNQLIFNPLYSNTGMRLKPRMAKKLIQAVDEVILPRFYKEVDDEIKARQARLLESQAFTASINKIVGLKVGYPISEWDKRRIGTLKNCPFSLGLNDSGVEVGATMSYDEFAAMAKTMGWGL